MEKYGDQIFELISTYVNELTSDINHEPIEKNSMLSPLGLDSIGRTLVIEGMIEKLGLSGPRYEFYQANNLGELADVFARKVREMHVNPGTPGTAAPFHLTGDAGLYEQQV